MIRGYKTSSSSGGSAGPIDGSVVSIADHGGVADAIMDATAKTWTGTSNTAAHDTSIALAISQNKELFYPAGNWLISTECAKILSGNGITIRGVPGKTKIIWKTPSTGNKEMWQFGSDTDGTTHTRALTSGIETTAGMTLGVTTSVTVNTLTTSFGYTLKADDYVAVIDFGQPYTYRSTSIVVTAVADNGDGTCTVTAPDHDFDASQIGSDMLWSAFDGDFGTVVNGESYTLVSFPDNDHAVFALDISALPAYTSGGQLGTGGTAGYVCEHIRIQSVNAGTGTITFYRPVRFNYSSGSQFAVWNAPLFDLEIRDIIFYQDTGHAPVASPCIRMNGIIGLKLDNIQMENLVTRGMTIEDCWTGDVNQLRVNSTPNTTSGNTTILGVQGSSFNIDVHNSYACRGVHLVQSGGKTQYVSTVRLRCFNNTGDDGNTSLIETHWNLQDVEFFGNTIGGQQFRYADNSQLGSGLTVRAISGRVHHNIVFNRAIGYRIHVGGGAVQGVIVEDNVDVNCKYGVYHYEANHLKLRRHRSFNPVVNAYFLKFTTGATQGFSEFEGIELSDLYCFGTPSDAYMHFQMNQQRVPLDRDKWIFQGPWRFIGGSTRFTTTGQMSGGVLETYDPGDSLNVAEADFGPFDDVSTGERYKITSGTYNITTGVAVFTVSGTIAPPVGTGWSVKTTSLSGTGAFSSFQNQWFAATISGQNISVTGSAALSATTFTDGWCNFPIMRASEQRSVAQYADDTLALGRLDGIGVIPDEFRVLRFDAGLRLLSNSNYIKWHNIGIGNYTTKADDIGLLFGDATVSAPYFYRGVVLPSSGFPVMAQQTTFPDTPSSGLLKPWASDGYNFWVDENGISRSVPRLNLKRASARDNSTTIDAMGGAVTASSGTITGQATATTDYYTREIRVLNVTSAVNNSNGTLEWGVPIYLNRAGRVEIIFGVETYVTNESAFIGLKPSGDLGTGNVSSITNMLGIGANSGQTTFRWATKGSGSNNFDDIGSNATFNASATYIYRLLMWWDDSLSKVLFQLSSRKNDGTRAVSTTSYTSNLPATSTALLPGIWFNNQNSGAAAKFALLDATYD